MRLAIVLRSNAKTYSPVAGATLVGPIEDMGPSDLPIDPDHNFPSRAVVSKSMVHLPDWSTIELPPHERHIREALDLNSALYLPSCVETSAWVCCCSPATGHAIQQEGNRWPGSFRDQAH